jgi:hypothetical protein
MYGSELKSTGDLDDSVESSAANCIRLGDLTEVCAVNVEDGVAGVVNYQPRRQNTGQEVSVVQDIEGIRPDLEAHPFVQLEVFCQGHIQLAE